MGNDTLFGDEGNDLLRGDEGNDDLFGLAGNDELLGGSGNDELFGGDGDDVLRGGIGFDLLLGEGGKDLLEGGADPDEFRFFLGSFNPSSPLAEFDVVTDFEGAGVQGGDEIDISSAGNLVFQGEVSVDPTAGALLAGAGNDLTDVFYTVRDGNTWLLADDNDNGVLDNGDFAVQFVGTHAFTEEDFVDNTTFVIAGTDGDDTISGTAGDDVIFGLGGDDTLVGLAGDDEIHGGTGNDYLDGGPGGFDNLFGEGGNDTLTLATSDFGGNASGGEGNDTLFGSDTSFSAFDNSLQGDAGDDDLHAGAVGSFLGGGSGSDRLFSSAADDQMDGGRDEFTFELDGAQDVFVYTGTGRWSEEGSFFGDQISGFQDGSDLFDMRGSGLVFEDLTILNEEFQTTITSERGTITIFENFGEPVQITGADFLF